MPRRDSMKKFLRKSRRTRQLRGRKKQSDYDKSLRRGE